MVSYWDCFMSGLKRRNGFFFDTFMLYRHQNRYIVTTPVGWRTSSSGISMDGGCISAGTAFYDTTKSDITF